MVRASSPAPCNDPDLEAASGTGIYEWRAAEDRLVWSHGLLRIYGRVEAPKGESEFSRFVHPEDRIRVEAETSSFLGGDAASYSHQFRIVRPDGSVRLVLDRGVIERDQKGRVQVIRGMNIDLGEVASAPQTGRPGDIAHLRDAELDESHNLETPTNGVGKHGRENARPELSMSAAKTHAPRPDGDRPQPGHVTSTSSPLVWGAAAVVLTLAATFIGLRLQVDGIALFWPAAGVGAGLMLATRGASRGAVAAGFIVALAIGNISQGRSLVTSLVFMTGNLTQAALVAWLLSRTLASTARLESLRAVGIFVALAMSVPAVVAVFTSLGLRWSGHTTGDLASSWWLWTSSHAVGLLITTPAVMLLRSPLPLRTEAWIEHLAIALYIGLTALIASTLHAALDPRAGLLLSLALLGPIVWWIYQRAPPVRAAVAALIVGTWVTWDASGTSFLHASPQEALISLVTTAAALLALGAWLARTSSVASTPKAISSTGAIESIRRGRPDFSQLSLFYSVYLLGAGLTQALTTLPGAWISIWPPNGFLLALFLVSPRVRWPWWALVAIVGELTGNAIWYGNSLPVALLFCAGNTVEAVAGAWLIGRFCPDGGHRATLRNTVCLIVLGAGLATMIGATLNSMAAAFEGKQAYWDAWIRLWTGDATGILIGAPIALSVLTGWTGRVEAGLARALEAAAVAAIFVGVALIALSGEAPLAYAVIPALLWTAVRFGRPGASAAAAFLALVTAAFTVAGVSPFAAGSPTSLNEELQVFLLISSLSGLLVAGLAYDRELTLTRLGQANQTLELRVAERTATLEKSEQALRASKERLQQALDAASAGVWESTPATGDFWASERALAIHGLSANTPLTHDRALAAIHPDDQPLVQTALKSTVETGVPFRMEMRALLPDGSVRWVLSRAELKGGSPHPRLVGLAQDITEHKLKEEALRAARDTFRQLVDRSPFGVYAVDADFRVARVSEGAQKLFGTVRPLVGRDLAEVLRILWPEPFASAAIARFRHTLETGEPHHAPNTTERRADIHTIEAYDWKIERIGMPDGRNGVVCHFYDLTERQRHEEQVELLMREVSHRSKNMLALIQAVARQTAATGYEEFLERFGQRLQALAASHDLLVRGDWKAVSLKDLVRSQLAHFGDEVDKRVTVGGPPVEVVASASQALGMALHELATNAAKHGALSNDDGRVTVNWDVLSDATGKARFTMEWVECGGPPVVEPSRRGFGSTVIGRMIEMALDCNAEIDFAPTGLIWRIECPAEGVLEGRSTPSMLRPDRAAWAAPMASTASGRVLVVEDEPLVAMEIVAALSTAGFEVIGPASTVAQARSLLDQTGCDIAVLDTNLGGEMSDPVALELKAMNIPFVVASGYPREQQPAAMQDAPLLGKPVVPELLVAEVGKRVRARIEV